MKKLLLLLLTCNLHLVTFGQTPDGTPADDFVITRVIDVRGFVGTQGKTWDYTAIEMYAIKDINRANYQFTFTHDAGVTTKIKNLTGDMFAKHLTNASDYSTSTVSNNILPAGSYFYAIEMYRVDNGSNYIKTDNTSLYRIIDETLGITTNMHFTVATGQAFFGANFYTTISSSNTWIGLKASDLAATPVFTAFDQWKGGLANNKYDKRISTTPNATFTPAEWNRGLDSGSGSTLGLEKKNNNISKTISLYPNPVSNGKIYLSNLTGIKTVNVYDITGKLLFSRQVDKELNVSALPQGIFVAKISQGDKFAFKKFIVNK